MQYTEIKDVNPLPYYKFNEEELVDELMAYINSTYNEHYVGENNVQYMDIIMADTYDQAIGFLKHSSGKYINRLGKKNGFNRNDVLKALHYLILLLHRDDEEKMKGVK